MSGGQRQSKSDARRAKLKAWIDFLCEWILLPAGIAATLVGLYRLAALLLELH